ncbi:VOC family protein [Nocardia niwae]|uniref:VOC family protein n=1 Tax=Nocardia niwae TaxID=626084 RepID=UPI0007A4544B|nr:VOC family protein [Nocardia niwae]
MGIVQAASCFMEVSDLDRSIRFYCDVLECRVAIHEPDVALLLTPDGFQLYLRVSGTFHRRHIGDLGVVYLIWSTDSKTELDGIEHRLRAHYPSTHTAQANGISFVDGIDPDGCRVLITYPSPAKLPREVIDRRFR